MMCLLSYQFIIIGVASWREMVREATGNDVNLQTNLLWMLINVDDAQEGLYWALEFNIPRDQWPWAITFAEEQDMQSNALLSILSHICRGVSLML